MRFLEFVPCGWRSARPKAAPVPAPARMTEEEAAALVSPADGESPEKRRRRASHWGEKLWKPSLGAISENAALAATGTVKAAAKGGRGGGGSGKDRVRVSPRREHEGFRHYGVHTMLPAFTPAPFFF